MGMYMENQTADKIYIYERVGGTLYRRESGSDPSSRQVIGYDDDPLGIREDEMLYREILLLSKTNETLRSELERIKVLYHLIKTNDSAIIECNIFNYE